MLPLQHVLLLDTDSMPLKDPATLFKSSEYLTYGNLFWPDYWHDDGLKGWVRRWGGALVVLAVSCILPGSSKFRLARLSPCPCMWVRQWRF
jgi:hypothetical protein